MNELVLEAGIGFGVEYFLQPVDDDLVAVGVAKLLVVGEPEIGMMMDAEIDGDQVRSQRDRRCRQETHSGAAFHRVENADARIGLDPDNAFQRRQSQHPRICGIVNLRRLLDHQPVVFDFGERGNAVKFTVALRHEGMDVKPAELGDDQIGIGRPLELDGDIGFQPGDVGLLHRAAKVDGDLAVGFLEVDQSRKDPEIAGALGDGDADRAGGIVRLGRAAENIEGVTFHLHHVADHGRALGAQRQAALVAQEQLAADRLFEPVDPPHQRGAGEAEFFCGIAKALVSRAREKRSQLIPGRIQNFISPVLRHRSTPVQ